MQSENKKKRIDVILHGFRRGVAALTIATCTCWIFSCFTTQHAKAVYDYAPFPTAGGGSVQSVNVSPHDPNLVLAAVDVAGVFRSTDGGSTWTQAWSGLKNHFDFAMADVLFDPVDPNIVWAASGKTWERTPGTFGHFGGLWRSDDAGQSWVRVNKNIGFTGQFDTSLRQYGSILWRDSSNNDRLVIGSSYQGLLESNDGGETFHNLIDGVGLVMSVRSDPTRSGNLYVAARDSSIGGNSGFWRSTDNGSTFSHTLPGASIHSVSVSPNGDILAAGDGYIGISSDGGTTWSDFSQGINVANYHRFTADADPFNPGKYIVAGFHKSSSATPKVFRRTSASDWEPVEVGDSYYTPYSQDGWHNLTGWFGAGPSSVTFHPTKEDVVFLPDWFTVNRSSDGGHSWSAQSGGLTTIFPNSIAWDLSSPTKVHMAFLDVGLYEGTVENGKLTANSVREEVGGSDPTLFHFKHEANTYTFVHSRTRNPADLHPQIYRRVNDGPWTQVFDSPNTPSVGSVVTRMAMDSSNGLLLAVPVAGDLMIYSENFGQSWQSFADPAFLGVSNDDITHLSFEHDRWIVQYSNGVSTTTKTTGTLLDGNWNVTLNAPDGMVVDPTNSDRWFGITSEGLVRSTDGGQDWGSAIVSGATQLSVANDGTLYAIRSDNNSGRMWILQSLDSGSTWNQLEAPPGYGGPGTFLVPDPSNGKRFLWGNRGIGVWLGEDKIPGDLNSDGRVDGLDFLTWQSGQSAHPLSRSDLLAWEDNYGWHSMNSSATTVPEPKSITSLFSCCSLLVLMRCELFRWFQDRPD